MGPSQTMIQKYAIGCVKDFQAIKDCVKEASNLGDDVDEFAWELWNQILSGKEGHKIIFEDKNER